MDGLTCIKTIRELERRGTITSHIPVIAVTANVRSELVAMAKQSGMVSFAKALDTSNCLVMANGSIAGRCRLETFSHTRIACQDWRSLRRVEWCFV